MPDHGSISRRREYQEDQPSQAGQSDDGKELEEVRPRSRYETRLHPNGSARGIFTNQLRHRQGERAIVLRVICGATVSSA
jgi:hypothetical protein